MRGLGLVLGALLMSGCSGNGDAVGPPPCGSMTRGVKTIVPGPGEEGFDAELAAKARRHDRMFAAVSSRGAGLNTEVRLIDTSTPGRAPFLQFALADGWDFEAVTGKKPEDLVVWSKSAGLYSGAGVAADAYRYGALRDAGEDCAEIEQARAQLIRGLEATDIAARITGGNGVMARSLVNRGLPSEGFAEPTPLFDSAGLPLPPEKNNGEWRNDVSGRYPSHIWEDSLSRDMLVGWAMAYGAAFEVAKGDDTLPADLMARLKENANLTARALMKVRESGFDLEIPDADGRLTFHAYLNENVIDRLYLPGVANGFHAVMALGIVSAFAFAAEDPEIDAYRDRQLVEARNLPKLADDDMLVVNLGYGANFSNFNMAFTGMYLAQRYLTHENADGFLIHALDHELYFKDEVPERNPVEMGQTFFDFIYAAGRSGARFDRPGVDPPADAIARGLETLRGFSDAPFFTRAVNHCDEAEIASRRCTLSDGTAIDLAGEVGRGDKLVSVQPIPMRLRPPSNYFWRSNPYEPNGGGGGGTMLSAVDFRVAYWMGRFIRIQ